MKINTDKHILELTKLLKIPTISAQPEHNKDIQKACRWLASKLNELKLDAEILSTKGHPIVYAENLNAGPQKPTVLIYGHYDVQSPDPLDQWDSKPFDPEIRSGNIYARGAADDKGQLYTWIAALEEIYLQQKKYPVNIKFLIEGEEEVGSRNLDDFIEDNSSLLETDICVISDSHALSEAQPLLTYGLKGLCYMEVNFKSLGRDVHSGLYGGNVINPAHALAQTISALKDEDGKITIPGFYEKVRELTKKEKSELNKFPFTEKEIKEETGASVIAGEKGFGVQERAGARPTLDVNGIWAGYTGEGPKTIIPAEATAKISMRLVPYQNDLEIAQLFENYIREIAPKGLEVSVSMLSGGNPIIMDKDSRFYKAAQQAMTKTFGNKPLFELSGGSIPVTATLKNLLNVDSILMGYGLPDDGLHSPNEKLSLTMFQKGIETNIEFLKLISKN